MHPEPYSQTRFIQRLKKALGDAGAKNTGDPAPSIASSHFDCRQRKTAVAMRKAADRQALLETLKQNSAAVNLNLLPVDDDQSAAEAVQGLVQRIQPEWSQHMQVAAWRHPLLDQLDIAGRLRTIGVPLMTPTLGQKGRRESEALKRRMAQASIGITALSYVIADSATLVLMTGPGQARSVSLLPTVHVAVARIDQILADLEELMVMLPGDDPQGGRGLSRCLTLITGPSKTADIEAMMVHGVHGPREVHLVLITGVERTSK